MFSSLDLITNIFNVKHKLINNWFFFQFTSITAIIAATAASQVYQPKQYNGDDIYQPQPALEQHGVYTDQSQLNHIYQRPAGEKIAKIISYHSENNGHNYHYAYETENG